MYKFLIMLSGILFCPAAIFSQTPVRGTVYESEMGDKLKNVCVQIDGTDICSTTDSIGQYKITVPNEKVYLHFTCEGYEHLYVKVRRNYEINIVMGQIYNPVMDVDVGYGSQRATEVTGSVSSIGQGHYQAKSYVSSTKRLKRK